MKSSPLFEKYRGPGLADWLVALACSALIAAEIQTQGASQRAQSAASYYFESAWVPQIHVAALVVDGLMLLLAMVWLLTPTRKFARSAMTVVALAGLALCWGEILYALRVQEGAVYRLDGLPFQPANNAGVIGAQVFGTYLLLRAPAGRLEGWRAWAVKLALAAAFWVFQFMVWQMVVPR